MNKPAEHWRREREGSLALGSLADWLVDTGDGAGTQLARGDRQPVCGTITSGRGLVETPNDFGVLGSKPSHPKLLDWLAAQLIENGWRLKPIHRLILTSATYRQAVAKDPEPLSIDTENKWLWHRRPMRLEAEMIRDRMLSTAGVLRTDLFGPSIPVGSYKNPIEDTRDHWRRSIYLQAHRSVRHPTLSLFDPPGTERSIGQRETSTAPEAALFALNSPLVWQLAEHFAERLKREAGTESAKQIEQAYLVALSRSPSQEELAIGLDLLGSSGGHSLVDYCHILLGLNEFIYIQ